jgi:hypothetical protein
LPWQAATRSSQARDVIARGVTRVGDSRHDRGRSARPVVRTQLRSVCTVTFGSFVRL